MISTAESWRLTWTVMVRLEGGGGERREGEGRGGRRRGEEGRPGTGSKAILARGPQSTMGMSYLFVQ